MVPSRECANHFGGTSVRFLSFCDRFMLCTQWLSLTPCPYKILTRTEWQTPSNHAEILLFKVFRLFVAFCKTRAYGAVVRSLWHWNSTNEISPHERKRCAVVVFGWSILVSETMVGAAGCYTYYKITITNIIIIFIYIFGCVFTTYLYKELVSFSTTTKHTKFYALFVVVGGGGGGGGV